MLRYCGQFSDKFPSPLCLMEMVLFGRHGWISVVWEVKPGFHYTASDTTTTQKQSDYKVEQSSFTLIALFWFEIGRCRGRNWLNGNQGSGRIFLSVCDSLLRKLRIGCCIMWIVDWSKNGLRQVYASRVYHAVNSYVFRRAIDFYGISLFVLSLDQQAYGAIRFECMSRLQLFLRVSLAKL